MANRDKDLAARAVACERWRWMPGMVDEHGDRVCSVEDGVPLERDSLRVVGLPDLADPATLGCLLALVREAWGDAFLGVQCDSLTWGVTNGELVDVVDGYFETEAEALVAALEAAPDHAEAG